MPAEMVVSNQADQVEGNTPSGGADELMGKPVGDIHETFKVGGMRFGAVPGWLIASFSFPDPLLATGVPIRKPPLEGVSRLPEALHVASPPTAKMVAPRPSSNSTR